MVERDIVAINQYDDHASLHTMSIQRETTMLHIFERLAWSNR